MSLDADDVGRVADLLRNLGIGLGRPAQRIALAEKILGSGRRFTDADAESLWKYALSTGAKSPAGVVFRILDSGEWAAFVDDFSSHRSFVAQLSGTGTNRGSGFEIPEHRRDDYQKERVAYAAIADGWTPTDCSETFHVTETDVRNLVDTVGRRIFGDGAADRWLTQHQ